MSLRDKLLPPEENERSSSSNQNELQAKKVDEVDVRAEVDEGSKSNENDLNYLFLKVLF